jgi:NADH dehydrogenase
VVIIGGGFGGLYAARALRGTAVDVTLVDQRNFHLFQPLLYQVATAGLSPGDITSALRWVLRGQQNARVWLAKAIGLDAERQRVILEDGELSYDTLLLATGARHHYFGHDDWERHAPGLKTVEDALEVRRRVLYAFEAAEREADPPKRRALLTFVIVGAGPTGVELAGAIAELARHTLRREFRTIDPTETRILLIEGTSRVLPGYPESLSAKCLSSLDRLGVTVRVATAVTSLSGGVVTVQSTQTIETISARTVLWAAGVKASPLGLTIADVTGAELDPAGRVIVGCDLTVKGYPNIFVIGDLAHFAHQNDAPLPAVAPVAMAQGRYFAKVIRRRLVERPVEPFRYRDKGQLATIGRAAAVADFGSIQFSGYLAWLLWLFVHLMYLVEFENRLLVFLQWAWGYVTRNRGARIIGDYDLRARDPNRFT